MDADYKWDQENESQRISVKVNGTQHGLDGELYIGYF